MADRYTPAEPDGLAESFAGVGLDDVPERSVEETVANPKVDMEKNYGDMWGYREKYGSKTEANARIPNPRPAGRIVTPGSTSRAPLTVSSDYKHTALPRGYFRLMTVRRLSDSPIVEVEAFPMNAAPEYAAMSYAWSSDVSSRAFSCNGQNSAVPGHVLDALSHLGQAWIGKKIWVDAICINQANDAEKAVQVAEMRQIYSQAKQVVIWLGAAENGSGQVIDNLEAFLQWGLRVRSCGFVPDEEGFRLLNPPPDSLLLAFGQFLARPWFHRVWVVQEMLLSKDTVYVCGNRFLNWKIFCLTVLLMKLNAVTKLLVSPGISRSLVEIAIANIFELSTLGEKAQAGLSPSDFIKLLNMGRLRRVSEPVDRVWGLLGLADRELRELAAPLINYSPESRRNYYQAYVDIGRLLLQRDPELDFLSIVPSMSRPPGMPSWCPNFHAAGLNGSSLQGYVNLSFHAGYLGKDKIKPSVEFGADPNTLKLRGFRLDKVDKIVKLEFRSTASWEEERIQTAPREQLALWDQQCLELAQAVFKQGPTGVPDAHWRTLSFDQLAGQPQQVLREAYSNFRNYANKNYALYPGNLTAAARKTVGDFIDKVNLICSRAYFSTTGGRVGVGPRNMATGDCVCIVQGAKVPYIMRFRPGDSFAEFVGDAYVDGVMYGEILKKGQQSEVFSIV
jgi:hypothetical protein